MGPIVDVELDTAAAAACIFEVLPFDTVSGDVFRHSAVLALKMAVLEY
jgi:hypothetical protein